MWLVGQMSETLNQLLIEKFNYLNRTIARHTIYETQRIVQVQTRDIAKAAVLETTGTVRASLQAYADSLSTNAGRNRSGRMKSLNQDVANQAQAATLRVYDGKFGGRRPYRQDDTGKWHRYSGGKMRAALDSGQLFRARADGIDMNTAFLDDVAAQWYRLNFGALPKGASTPAAPSVSMTFFGSQTLVGGSLSQYTPSKTFQIPPGIFSHSAFATTGGQPIKSVPVGSDRGEPFYPAGAGLNNFKRRNKTYRINGQMASGIVGGRFLDAGVTEINRVLPIAMEQLISEWTAEAAGASYNRSGSLRSAGGSGPFAQFLTEQKAYKLMSVQANKIRRFNTQATNTLRIELARNRRIFPA